MTLQQLTYLVTAAECGNMTEAAEKLFISQPSLSAAIKNLEEEMGVTIFVRSNKGIVPTREGEELLSYARMLLEQAEIMKHVQQEDLLRYGLIPEFIGRLPVLVTLEELSKDALVRIITEPKNALVKQYKKLFDMDHVELEIQPDAIEAIAEKALERKTGARGLRGIMEKIMTNIMYEVPSRDDVKKCIITRETVEAEQDPELVLAEPKLADAKGQTAETA